MKRKILIIIFVSTFITYFIYFNNKTEKIYLTALGDGVSSGETSYEIDGISYNDYLKEYFYNKNILKRYNSTYSIKDYNIRDLIDDINNNKHTIENNTYIKQIIHKSNIITLAIGEDELTKLAMLKELDKEKIDIFIANYDILINLLKSLTNSKIVIISLYENNYLDKTNSIIINSEIANIAKKYNVIFVNISDMMLDKNYYLNEDSYYFSYKGHEDIAEIIIHSL